MGDFRAQVAVDVDSSKLDKLKADIQALNNKSVRIKVDLDQSAMTQLKQLNNQQYKSKISVDTSGIQKATSDFQMVKRAANELSNKQIKLAKLELNPEKNTNQIKELGTQVKQLETDYQSLGRTFNDSFSTQQKGQLEGIAQSAKEQVQMIKAEAKDLQNVTKSLARDNPANAYDNTTASNGTLKWLQENTKATKKYGEALTELAAKQKNASTVGEASDLKKQVNAIKSTASLEGLTGKSFFDELGRGFKQIGQFVGVYGAIQYGTQLLKQMGTEVLNIDSSLTELRKVSDIPESQMSGVFERATKTAKEYGRTISDVISSTADWNRLGYSNSESEKLAGLTSLYQNVGDNMTQESASKSLVSTLQGFKIDASEAEAVVDKINAVGNNYAIDTAGIGEALQRSASTFEVANTDLSSAIALITASNEVVQNPEKVGNMWKTVGLRIRGAETELEEMGESTDGIITSTSTLRELVKGMTGFDIMADEAGTQFKDLKDITVGIGKEFDKLNDIDQSALLEALSGKHQANSFAAALRNWEKIEQIYNTAENESAGSAQRENEIYMQSLEAKLNTFKASFQEFSNTAINSDFLKGIVDGGTVALNVITQLVDQFGILTPLLSGIGIAKFIKNFDSLKNTGNIFNAIKSGSDITSILKDVGNLEKASKVLDTIGGLSASDKYNYLSKAFGGLDGVSDDALRAASGLTAMDAAAAGATTGVSGLGSAFSGLAASIGISTTALGFITAGVAALTVGLFAYKAYNNYIQEQVESASQAGQKFSESLSSLDEQKAKITELKTSLDSGTLTEQEAYQAKSELLSIQQQLSASYGEQVSGIDLVNGALDTQIAKLEQVSEAEAKKFINENETGINKAKKEMTEDEHHYLGTVEAGLTEEGQKIKEIAKDYEKLGLSINENSDGAFTVHFNGDVTEAQSVINDFMSDVRDEAENFEGSNVFDNLFSTSSDSLKGIQEKIDTYQELYNQAVMSDLIRDKDTVKTQYDKEDTNKTYGSVYKDYAESVQKYNDALLDGDTSKIETAKTQFDGVKNAVDKIVESNPQYKVLFDDVGEQLNKVAAARSKFENEIEKDNKKSVNETYKNSLNNYGKQLKNLKLSDLDFKIALDTDGVQKGESVIRAITDSAYDIGLISGKTGEDVQGLIDILVELGYIDSTPGSLDDTAISVKELQTQLESALTAQDNLNAAMASSVSAKGLSSEEIKNVNSMFSGMDSYDDKTKAILFEKTANGVHLNSKALRELQKEQENTTKAGFLESRQKIIDQLSQEQERLKGLTEGTEEYNSAQSKINGFKSDISDLDLMASQYNGATSAYQKWVDAQSAGEEGDMYDSFQTAIDRGKELRKEGLVGTNEFRAIANLFSNEDLSTAPVDDLVSAFDKASPTIKKFFTEGQNGASKFLDTMNKTKNEAGDAYAEWIEDANGKGLWKFNAGNDEDLANQLGISVDAVQAIMRKLNDYGFDVAIGDTTGLDSYTDALDKVKTKAEEAQVKIKEMSESSDVTTDFKNAVDFDMDSLDSVDALKNKINEIEDTCPTLEADAEAYNQAQSVIDGCQAKIDEMNGTTNILSFDIEGTDNVDDLEGKLKEVEDYQATLDVNTSRYEEAGQLADALRQKIESVNLANSASNNIGGNFNQLQDGYEKVQQLQSALQELSAAHANPTVSAEGVAEAEAQVQSAADAIAALPPEVRIQMGITGEKPEEIANELMTKEVKIPVIFDQKGNKSDLDLGSEEKEINVSVNVNSGEIDSLNSTLSSLPSDTPVTVTLTAIGMEQVTTLKDAIESLGNKDINITASVSGTDQITALTTAQNAVTDKEVTTKSEVKGTDLVKALTAAIASVNSKSVTVSASVNGTDAVRALASAIASVQSKTVTVTSNNVTNNIVNNISGGGSGGGARANGTVNAHSNGTVNRTNSIVRAPSIVSSAFSDGTLGKAYTSGTNISIPNDQEALVNELGEEGLVRGGQLIPIIGGAQMIGLKRGDIIFNHKQMEQLRKNGYVTANGGRGKTYAEGTIPAYSSGSGKFYGSSASSNGKSAGSSSSSKSSSSSNSSNSATKAAKSATSAATSAAQSVEDALKAVSNLMDWITVRIERLQSKIDNYAQKSENAVGYSKKNSYIGKESSTISKLMSTYNDAIGKYNSKAEYVGDKVGLSQAGRTQVRNGELNIQDMDETTKKKVEAFKEWIDKIDECKNAIEELKQKQKELAQQKLDNIIEHYEALTGKYDSAKSVYEASNEYRKSKGYSESKTSTYYNNLKSQRSSESSKIKALEKESSAYAAELKKAKKVFGENSKEYREAYTAYKDIRTELYESKTAYEELNDAIRQVGYNLKQWAVDKWTRALDKFTAYMSLLEARGTDIPASKYLAQMNLNNRQIIDKQSLKNSKLQELSLYSSNSEKFQEIADEIAAIDVEILNLAEDNEVLQNSIRNARYLKFDDNITALDNEANQIRDLLDLINDDSLVYNDGKLTSQGSSDILLTAKGIELAKQKIANYTVALNKLEEEKKNGVITQREYNEYSNEYLEIIRESAGTVANYEQSLTDLYTKQIEKQNDALKKTSDKYKDALKNKKSYYEYDKKLKDKNKDISSLKMQIAALEGTTNAAAQSRLEKLKAELLTKEDELNDIVKDHEYEIRIQGYDKLSSDADQAMNDTLEALKTNADMQQTVVDSMLSSIKDSYKDAYSEINRIILESGIILSDSLKNALDQLDVNSNGSGAQTVINNATKDQSDVEADSAAKNINTSSITQTSDTAKKNEATANAIVDKVVAANDTAGDASAGAGTGLVRVTGIKLSKTSVSLTAGKSIAITATISPNNATNKSVTWSSSNTAIATVSGGTIKAVKAGSATITCTTKDASGKSATCKVKVISKSDATLSAKQGKTNTGTSVTNKYLGSLGYGTFSKADQVQLAKDLGISGATSSNIYTAANQAAIKVALQKKLIKDWMKTLGAETRTKTQINALNALPKYVSTKYSKYAKGADLVNLSKMLEIKAPSSYSNWTSANKSSVLTAFKKAGFQKGGIVSSFIPTDAFSQSIIRKNGDDGLISAKTGETVMPVGFKNIVPDLMRQFDYFANADFEKNVSTPQININYDNLINIEGNVDKNVMADLNKFRKQIANDVTNHLADEFGKLGYKK